MTRQCEIVHFVPTFVLLRDNMLNVKPKQRIGDLGKVTVLAPFRRPRPHPISRSRIHGFRPPYS